MKRTAFLFSVVFLCMFSFVPTASAQTCLLYPSNSTPPGMPYPYGASWDVTSPGKELLVKSNCPTSGNDITITIGKGDTNQFIWQHGYMYNTALTPARWATTTLSGTVDANGWITSGSGTKTITTPFTATAANPLYFVGYVCTFHASQWKCGCANASCTQKYWQLQGYKGTGGGVTAVATPVFSPNGGYFASSQNVTITTATAGAEIRYTLDGSIPDGSSTLYTGAINLTSTTMVRAIGIKSGMPNSGVASAQFTKGSAPANRSGLPWLSGYWSGATVARLEAFGEWRNRPVDMVLMFISIQGDNPPGKTWSNLQSTNVISQISAFNSAGYKVSINIPLVVTDSFMQFGQCASGNFDSYHRVLAGRIHDEAGSNLIYLRLGHEATRGYPWSYANPSKGYPNADPTEYKNCWKRIAQIYKSEIPGAKMVWNHLKNHTLPIERYYPGDDVVDVIGIDPYDNCEATGCVNNEAEWTQFLGSYNASTGMANGLGGLLAFAKAHGKKLSLCEWGPSQTQIEDKDLPNDGYRATHGSNNPFYVRRMFEWLQANSNFIEYEITYNGPPHQIWPRVEYLGVASDAYRAAWSR